MVNIDALVDEVIGLLDAKKSSNYRVAVIIVGPPGSGKSTIANKLCQEINTRFNQYLQSSQRTNVELRTGEKIPDLTSGIHEIPPVLSKELNENQGILRGLVEDTEFKPVKMTSPGKIEVIGRGGMPNSFTISEDVPLLKKNDIAIAQTIPMDGFHLSRKCLDCFKDPKWAHERRGSPSTFDSNNFLQLCETLAKTCTITPPPYQSSNCFDFISNTFISNLPAIRIAGFDHRVKDPTPNHYCIDGYTRILIFEGLYLLYNKENWKEIFKTLSDTEALLIWNVDIDEAVIQDRVAKRHLEAGLVDSLAQGRERFRINDLINARLIKENMINTDRIVSIRND